MLVNFDHLFLFLIAVLQYPVYYLTGLVLCVVLVLVFGEMLAAALRQ